MANETPEERQTSQTMTSSTILGGAAASASPSRDWLMFKDPSKLSASDVVIQNSLGVLALKMDKLAENQARLGDLLQQMLEKQIIKDDSGEEEDDDKGEEKADVRRA